MSTLANDLRLAFLLTQGSDRREWWRVTLTALGAALATGLGLAAAVLASLQGRYQVPVADGLLNNPGQRSGVILTLLLLLVPVLGFLGQCARVGAVHRDRRLAGLRLAGASVGQVRRIAALEAGIACLIGSLVVTVFFVLSLLREWRSPSALAWAGIALVSLGVPALGALVSVLALRRVVASPLGWVRRVGPRTGRGPQWVFLGAMALLVLVALAAVASTYMDMPDNTFKSAPLTLFAALLVVGAGAVLLSGAAVAATGGELPVDCSLHPLGRYRLKDFDDAEPVDKVVETAAASLRVHLSRSAEVEALKARLENAKSARGGEVILVASLGEGREADIKLPGAYVLDAALRGALKTAPGVVFVEDL